ncbi:MAG: lytic transglycosylase domain-containing protein [Clostridiales bacterium]|nr:lytic transglycosylase domain-containing protein [Clostridiales bacterium]
MKPIKKFLLYVLIACIMLAIIGFAFNRPILKMIFPVKHEEQINCECEKFGLEPSLIYGIIRVESGFDKNAQSHAQAIGLMQIMPETFAWLRDNNDTLPNVDIEQLYDPDINIEYGCFYINMLLNKFKNEETAIAAYNAGPGNVEAWLKNSEYSKDGITLYKIPIGETEKYIKRVSASKEVYKYLYFTN